jgi:hypothetical protein
MDSLKRKNKAPYIQNSGEWPSCGWKICGILYERMKQEKIYVSIKTGVSKQWENAPNFTSMKQIMGGGILHKMR